MSENEMPAEGLEKVLQYMTSVPAWYLATSVDGQPHVRPFSFAQIQDGKTSSSKPPHGGRGTAGSFCAARRG